MLLKTFFIGHEPQFRLVFHNWHLTPKALCMVSSRLVSNIHGLWCFTSGHTTNILYESRLNFYTFSPKSLAYLANIRRSLNKWNSEMKFSSEFRSLVFQSVAYEIKFLICCADSRARKTWKGNLEADWIFTALQAIRFIKSITLLLRLNRWKDLSGVLERTILNLLFLILLFLISCFLILL